MIFDPQELNYSKIRAYLDCPFLYRYIYVERKFAPQTPYSSLGLSVHRAIGRYHVSGGDLGDLLAHYEDAWLHQGYASAQEGMEFYNRGARVLEAWWMYFQEHRAQVIYSEKNFEFLHGKWRIKGTIDRVDRLPGGAVELIDYKMGFEDRNEWDVAGSLQLAIYALGLSRGLAQKVGSVGYFILTSLQKIAVPYDPSKEAATLEFISATAEKMLAQDMGRKGECARCAIRKFCPESSARD
jgi:putative RecB family exonuclease